MKSSSILFALLLVCTLMNMGCKSNPITPPLSNPQPEITLIPDSLHGIEYLGYTLKAKILNHDFAQTYFTWDMGDGTRINGKGQTVSYQRVYAWSRPGNFTVKVEAYDIYTDSIIATKSMNVIIDTFHHSVEIVPQFYNGVLKIDGFGNLSENFSLSAKFSETINSPYIYWDFGDGSKDSTSGSNVLHRFRGAGTYIIKVNVFQANKIFDCSDTAVVVINYPEVSLARLSQMGKVQAVLYLDTSYHVGNVDPLGIGLLFSNSGGYSSEWNGGSFLTQFHTETGSGTGTYELKDFLISGVVSTDSKTVNSISVHVEDTTAVGKVNTMVKYGFKAGNAQLVAATDDQIIYKVISSDLKNTLHDLSILSYWKDNSECPGLDPYLGISTNYNTEAQLLIIFTKQ